RRWRLVGAGADPRRRLGRLGDYRGWLSSPAAIRVDVGPLAGTATGVHPAWSAHARMSDFVGP
ncbi:MAG: hypothetical protein ACXVRM_14210, partial [Solirubrobacteraceae bacterium]